MAKRKKWTRLVLAAIPLVYHRLYRRQFGNRRRTDRRQPLPPVAEPADDFYLTEAGYAEAMAAKVLPYLTARETRGSFKTRHRLNYSIFRADVPKAAVVISHGFGESITRYYETIYYFLNMGFDVFMPEHYGHGDSDCGVEDKSLVWVDRFETYTEDLATFIKNIVRVSSRGLPLVIFSHSMGGAIAASCLQEYPDICDGAILSAPMLQIFLLIPESLAYPLTGTLSQTALKKTYFIGEKETERLLEGSFDLSRTATHSQARGSYNHARLISAPKPPRWVVSWGWAHEAMKATHEIVRAENVRRIQVPLLMFQAGIDLFVDPKGMYEFAAHARDLEFYKVHGSFHEIYTETDEIIVPYFNKIHEFIAGIVQAKSP